MRLKSLSPLLAAVLTLAVGASVVAADRDGDGLGDVFESRWGVTDPDRWDSDNDGVIDSAEDSDGDRLSNLGEQRLGSDPGKRDSDGDGKPDGSEDDDRDGLSNALEQDRRPIPKGTRPVLSKAKIDKPAAQHGCVVPKRVASVKRCVFGDSDSTTTVALFGDSHAMMWVPALRIVARQQGWKLITLIKGACPIATAGTRGTYAMDRTASCHQWRRNATAWLRQHPPDVIVVSGRNHYILVNADGTTVPESKRPRRWRTALTRTLSRLPAESDIVVLADAPEHRGNPVRCLKEHRRIMSACAARRLPFLRRPYERAERQAALAVGADFTTLYGKICSYDPCPLVQGKVLVWRDRGHLTATFTRLLAPSIRQIVLGGLP